MYQVSRQNVPKDNQHGAMYSYFNTSNTHHYVHHSNHVFSMVSSCYSQVVDITLVPLCCQIFVFCCAHADLIRKYLQESKWLKQREPKITTIVSTNCLSAGEALRSLDQKDIIKSDFILVSGDSVSNMKLAPALAAHRARREKDKNAIMTMVRMGITAHEQVTCDDDCSFGRQSS